MFTVLPTETLIGAICTDNKEGPIPEAAAGGVGVGVGVSVGVGLGVGVGVGVGVGDGVYVGVGLPREGVVEIVKRALATNVRSGLLTLYHVRFGLFVE